MSLATEDFTYRLSHLDGVPRIDVRGTVAEDHVVVLVEAIDLLVDDGAESLVLSLAQAEVSRDLAERLTGHAHARLSPDRVLVDSTLAPEPYL